MNARFSIKHVEPGAYKAMNGFEEFMATADLQPLHKEMIKIRASQLNGCAYCVNSHTRDARKLGETDQRLALICVWKEAQDIFTEEEQLILAMTDEITLISQHGLSDETYDRAIKLFGEKKTAHVIMAVITINVWNRIGVSLRMKPN